LNDALTDDVGDSWERYALDWDVGALNDGMTVPALWRTYGETVLTRWLKDCPGTRPSLWWRFDAPRKTEPNRADCFWDGKLPQARMRIGGIGRPIFETQAYVPDFFLGVPKSWLFGDEYRLTPACEPIDESDPPIFESQASYLKRHGFLLKAEERRASFEPESVSLILQSMRPGQSDMQDRFGLPRAD
jgi:hypothetical protein